MSDNQSQVLLFPLALNSPAGPWASFTGNRPVWPAQSPRKALLRQNLALRAQNAALKLALGGEADPGNRLGPAKTTSERSPDLSILRRKRRICPATDCDISLCLTNRQHQVLALVLAGCPSKNIAADLGISQRTVENHRAEIMRRTGATSIPALARMVIGAAQSGDCKAAATRQSSPV